MKRLQLTQLIVSATNQIAIQVKTASTLHILYDRNVNKVLQAYKTNEKKDAINQKMFTFFSLGLRANEKTTLNPQP